MVTPSMVRIVRAYLDLTQSQLAKRMGVSAGSVSSVEKGINRLTPEFAIKFKQATGIEDKVLIDIQYLQTKFVEVEE
ncbi:helix-turn-helix transcriptional regulator [Neobacillus cucumis]|uniref:helix-turn-helix transcriptional regulator n=1 Tax=Neobacillus cucumis TaxID=1740721 RepID=UPI002E222564|nr:helix-turn-helix transcriptional regulator [Neobacillus cucumis]